MIAAMNGNEDNAKELVDWLNSLEPGLSLTYEWSNKEITFLDTKLVIEDGKLETDWFIKATNPQMFLHHSSKHRRSVFKAIVYGQGIKARMICSKDEYLIRHMKNFSSKFNERG